MKRKEKIDIMKKCTLCYQKAIMTKTTDTNKFLMYLGAGIALKQIIEEHIDCQSQPYYGIYMNIIKYSNYICDIGD